METTYPTTIRIGPIVYSLAFIDDFYDDESENPFGRVTISQSLLEIRSGMDPQQTLQTILHECLHAMLIQIGNPPNTTEGTVDALSYSLIDFLADNKFFLEEIQRWSSTTITVHIASSDLSFQ